VTAVLHAWWSHPPQERAGRPVVVALHGRGHDESTLAVLAPDLGDVVLACPRGIWPEGSGYAWWQMHTIGHPVARSLASARAALLSWLDAEVGDVRVALLGFSDGATTAGDLLLTAPQRFDTTVLLAGALPWTTDLPAEPGRLSGRRVLLSWGADDEVVPRELLERSAAWLEQESGAEAEVVVEPGLAHLVAGSQVERCRALLAVRGFGCSAPLAGPAGQSAPAG
jgi:phospholipase/carboxylesterase